MFWQDDSGLTPVFLLWNFWVKKAHNFFKTSLTVGSSNIMSLINPVRNAEHMASALLTPEQVTEGCKVAREYDVASVCVKPSDVKIAQKELAGSDVLVTTVVGFPHGSSKTEIKVFEAEEALRDGAVELDMVLNIGRLLSEDFEFVENDIKAVAAVAHERGAICKVILENCYLSDRLKKIACQIAEKAGADFVKTSTGFGTGGAIIEDLVLMRATCGPKVRIKAAGGVRTLDAALAVRRAGAVRFGATATKEIIDEAVKRDKDGCLN